MLDEPRSGRLAAWGNALIAGLVSPDDAATRITDGDTVHRVTGLPPAGGAAAAASGPGEAVARDAGGPVALTWALGRLRTLGARGFRVALPVAGHPLGLSGPPEFNGAAIEAGEAVIGSGAPVGLVPEVAAAGPEGDRSVVVVWRCLPVRDAPPADVPSLAEAERELNDALREATATLTGLGVAGSGAGAQAALEAYRARRTRSVLAPGYPPRAVRVLELAQRVDALVAIADGRHSGGGGEHGAAVSASEMAARARALRPLERTARRAQVAAYNAFVEEAERVRDRHRTRE